MPEIPGASRPAALRFAVPCELTQVRPAARNVHRFLAEQGCDDQLLSACDLALVEACINAIKYAPASAQSSPVLVEVIAMAGLIELRITDHTLGFQWPGRIELPDPECDSGRGLYLIQSLMDSADYLRGNGENVLVLRKSCPSANGAHNPLPMDHDCLVTIQQSLLSKGFPHLPGFELAGLCRSVHPVGGDFYDALKINDHSVLLVVADVMGKGILAAMFAAIFRALLRTAPELTTRPAALLTHLNQLLFDELSAVDTFITAQLAFVDAAERKLVVAGAGHCPLLVANGADTREFSPEGMPLGILSDAVFASETVDLPKNCRVLLYTDGLTDALDATGERLGHERLAVWLKGVTSRAAGDLKDELLRKLAHFQSKTGLNDDQTFLIMTG